MSGLRVRSTSSATTIIMVNADHEVRDKGELVVWTVGHSTRSEEEFDRLLIAHQVKNLVDVRSFPASRRLPHFNKEALSSSLARIKIDYQHMPLLGGRRRPQSNSKNTAWQNASFRAYADYMETKEFEQGIAELLKLAHKQLTAIMCAEALWWRCHRGLIADYLKAQGVNVIHIVSETKTELHPFTSAARIVKGKLSYEGLLPES